jgi:hypothetical protein
MPWRRDGRDGVYGRDGAEHFRCGVWEAGASGGLQHSAGQKSRVRTDHHRRSVSRQISNTTSPFASSR